MARAARSSAHPLCRLRERRDLINRDGSGCVVCPFQAADAASSYGRILLIGDFGCRFQFMIRLLVNIREDINLIVAWQFSLSLPLRVAARFGGQRPWRDARSVMDF